MIRKIISTALLSMFLVPAFAYQNTGINGVDTPISYGAKIGMAFIFLLGLAAIGKGISKLISEEGSGKAVAGMYIGIGIITLLVLGFWTTQMSGFSF